MTQTEAAATVLGLRLRIVKAASPGEIEEAFAQVAQSGAGALLISGEPLFLDAHGTQLVALASRAGVPTIYAHHEVTRAGGLLSYGTDLPDLFRIAGTYVGRILNGEKPADLPVQQSTKVKLALNMKTAKTLGLTSTPITGPTPAIAWYGRHGPIRDKSTGALRRRRPVPTHPEPR
jgi:putative ABC transport system substrate-binding protein